MRDVLPPTPHPVECGILNHDDSDGPGTHWTCWHKSRGSKAYFDPNGLPPLSEMGEYLRPKIRFSTDEIQRRGTAVCWHFCLYVLKLLANGWPLEEAVFSLWING